ncbi:MAG TPA: ribonuclease HI [Candidatus Limadaptatus stercoripullorum]|uniref:Ribonuclease H n=1 Tax=Candidatus Limadaptatus stercoripullorum TaxID=2840846 RepID=A0A9D1SWA0_9FIRM|nr:ribonuclease HI [Candidatus Limadaptatus stercoripullorum]
MRKKVDIYTDGACSGNPGVGGWGAVLFYRGVRKEMSGAEGQTTNNRMELTAMIRALSALKEDCEVTLYSDSAYCVDAFNKGWIASWKANGWRTADKSEVKNPDLWQELLALAERHKVTFVKVKGHSDNEHNNRCDALARAAIKAYAAKPQN